ncbi:DUF4261 domain-containing protein [Roseomonas sp. CAU 1739]|uniref:DUF4261 domain-containing protein n=1 Tax=Roseomonas sp. CAU 1739 TaxID=3140364 RepID=UPI00325B2F75
MPDVVATQSRFIAYVALSAAARVSGPAVATKLAERYPEWARTAQAIEASGVADAPAGFLLLVGEQKLLVSFIDAPLPADCFQDDAHQRLWVGWEAAARAQRAHVIVANLDTASDAPGKVQAAAPVFATAATLCELVPETLGVSWAASALFIAPDAIRQAAAAMRPDQLPVSELIKPCWYAGEPPDRQSLGLLTMGLAPFVGREIDHPPTGEQPSIIYNRCLNLALYLMRSGPVIRDGDTVGQTPTQRIVVRFGERGGVPTYQLDISTAG